MSRLVVMLSVSLDGFFEAPGGDISWHRVSDALHRDMNEALGASGGLLNGRRNWELMTEYWPHVPAPATAPDAPAADAVDTAADVEREFAAIWARLPQHVFSTTLTAVEHGATLHRTVDVVPALLQQADGDLYAGGGALATALAERGWVDRWVLNVVPVVLGAGTPLLRTAQELRLTGQRTYDDGVVQLTYDVVRP